MSEFIHQVARRVCDCKSYDEVVAVYHTYKISWHDLRPALEDVLSNGAAYGPLQYVYWYASGMSSVVDDTVAHDEFHRYMSYRADLYLSEQSQKIGLNLDV